MAGPGRRNGQNRQHVRSPQPLPLPGPVNPAVLARLRQLGAQLHAGQPVQMGPGQQGLGAMPFVGPEPFGYPGYSQRLAVAAQPGDPGTPGAIPQPNQLPGAAGIGTGIADRGLASPTGPANPFADVDPANLPLLEVLRLAAQQLVWIQHPSPIDTKPILGTREQFTTTAVVDPPADTASAAALMGGDALKAGYDSYSGGSIDQLAPATAASFVTVFSYTVPRGRAFLIWSVAGEAHDLAGMETAIRWLVSVGTTRVVPETQLAQIGAPSNQLVVQEVATEGQTIYFQCRNLDPESASLVTAYMLGWSFPLSGTGTTWEDLVAWGGNRAPRGEDFEPLEAQRISLVFSDPNPAWGNLRVWVDPRDGSPIWAPTPGIPGLGDQHPQFNGYRMFWAGNVFMVDEQRGPVPGFDLESMTIDGQE